MALPDGKILMYQNNLYTSSLFKVLMSKFNLQGGHVFFNYIAHTGNELVINLGFIPSLMILGKTYNNNTSGVFTYIKDCKEYFYGNYLMPYQLDFNTNILTLQTVVSYGDWYGDIYGVAFA